jgi:SAM-dependent methyltransferase
MKICIRCCNEIVNEKWLCSKCNWIPNLSSNVILFSPHIIGKNESYDPVWFAELARLEVGNFWFVSRNYLIEYLISKYLSAHGKYLEIGCGTGYVLQMFCKSFPNWQITATEAQPEGIKFAKERVGDNVDFFQMDACNIPFKNEFDAIGAFDVIEHIFDDEVALNQIYKALKVGGYFFLSVPQHMFLWSKYDEVGGHFRRYSQKDIEDKLKKFGFKIYFSTSYNSLLIPLMIVSRFLKKNKSSSSIDVLEELKISKTLNTILSLLLSLEIKLIKYGVSFPFGGSRVIVVKKMDL